jgi:hypothetical protein
VDEENVLEVMRSRARELLPQVLLTVLSIIQALALEVLWSSMHESPHLWNGGLTAAIGWIQVLAVFLGILVMWLFYISLVFRYSWTPTISDSAVPFMLGVLEFTMAEMLEPELLHYWFYVLAAIFAGASATSVAILRRALADDANREMKDAFDYSIGETALQAGGMIGTLLIAGLVIHWRGPEGWVALSAVIIANLMLLLQMGLIRSYWNRSLHQG